MTPQYHLPRWNEVLSQRKSLLARLRAVIVIPIVAFLAALAACSSSSSTSSAGAASTGHQGTSCTHTYNVAMLKGLANQFQDDIVAGAQSVAKQNCITVSTYIAANANSQQESADVSSLIAAHKINLLLYDPVAPATGLENIIRLKNAGIPVICFDSCIANNLVPTYVKGFVTSNNTQLGTSIGTAAAAYIRTHFGGNATVAYVTCDSEGAVCTERLSAITNALGAVHVTTVANQDAVSSDQVTTVCDGILTAHTNSNLVILTNGLSETVGCVAAIASSKRHVPLFGMDIVSAAAEDLISSNDILQATMGQNGILQGQVAMKMAVDVLNGKPVSPFYVQIPGVLYTRSNLALARAYLQSHGS